MNNLNSIFPSSQIDSTLPQYIVENYEKFVDFMTTANEAHERVGFGQDILQNLQNYRDFDTFAKGIVKSNFLSQYIDTDSNELTLENSYGFPDENGVILIDEEIILYRRKEGNTLVDLQRGSSGTIIQPTFTTEGLYSDSCIREHFGGAKVTNLSVLFLASMLDVIYSSFAPNLDPSRINSEVNQSSLLANIRDFFQSKGTKLGIKSLFKMIFGDKFANVEYPGDQMIIPSVSTFSEDLICRVVPLPSIFYDANELVSDPRVLIGSRIECRSYNDDVVYGSAVVEYTKIYPFEDTIQYDLLLNKDSLNGEIIPNPTTTLTRKLFEPGTGNDQLNAFTLEVESTFGFPSKGMLFIGFEAIYYDDKTDNEFLFCSRGRIGQTEEYEIGTVVSGPYYITGDYVFQNTTPVDKCSAEKLITTTNRSWATGLVDGSFILNSGLLHTEDDIVTIFNTNGTVREDIKIKVSDISSGNISSIFIQDPGNNRSSAGDFLYFDNTDTFGVGAEAKVSWLRGECIETAIGCPIITKLISHRQRIDLSSDINSDKFVFIPGQFLETFGNNNIARALVVSYDQATKILIVQTITPNLIAPRDSIRDSRGNEVVIFSSSSIDASIIPPALISGSRIQDTDVSNLTILSFQEPIARLNGAPLESGDLWWSIQTGRLYVYYDDGTSSQWVSAQPYANRPFGSFANNMPIGYAATSAASAANPPVKSQIIISDTYPERNPDGSALRIGDLWWSPLTGLLYIWNSDVAYGGSCASCRCDAEGNIIENSAEWVCTDPTGLLSYDREGPQASTVFGPSAADPLSADVRVIISPTAPAGEPDATLWWSSDVGRLFVRYDNTWVITTPFGTPSSVYSFYPDGSQGFTVNSSNGGFLGPVSGIPELNTTEELFFTSLCDFYPGDEVEVYGSGRNEFSKVTRKNSQMRFHSLNLHRDDASIELYDGYLMENKSRYKITIQTEQPHRLQPGDFVRLKSLNPELNRKEFEVVDVGNTVPALGFPEIVGGEIVRIVVTNPGDNYKNDFYIRFIDDFGSGAVAVARVVNGQVSTIDILEPGINYSNNTQTIFNIECSVYYFVIYTNEFYSTPQIISYEAKGDSLEGYVSDFDLISGGIQYRKLPKAPGLYKRQIDRAQFIFDLSGTTITDIIVKDGGARYVNPIAIVLDANGKGNGADIDLIVQNGVIVDAIINDGGIDYENPYIIAIEEGQFIPETDNIGKIKAFDILAEGRNVNSNPDEYPIIDVETKLQLQYPVYDPCVGAQAPAGSQWNLASWQVGDLVYQGPQNTVFGTVTDWDSENQILSVNEINGKFTTGSEISDTVSNTATILKSGQSNQISYVSGTATIGGRFITDKSVLSSNVSNIQDGKYYQLFSYVISSSIQRNRYESFVDNIIHPAGFVYFSKFKLDGGVDSNITVEDPSFGIATAILPPTNPSPAVVTLTVAPSSVLEDGTANLVYTFSRSGDRSNSLTVNYTVGGTATIDVDYTGIDPIASPKTVTIPAGLGTATVVVNPTPDTTFEGNETVILTLISGTGYTIGNPSVAIGTITNDDAAPIPPTLVATPNTINEGETITVNWANIVAPDATDRIAAYLNGSIDPLAIITFQNNTLEISAGSVDFINFTTLGEIVFKYLPNGGTTPSVVSNVVTVNSSSGGGGTPVEGPITVGRVIYRIYNANPQAD